jgi:hypothetical protein
MFCQESCEVTRGFCYTISTMAVYKVAQDVEADDKLLGPFSFRQFIYLIIVVIAGALAWGLAQVFVGLAIIPLPIILFFGALALPLRKDQPMEIYLAAILSFYLKPRRRLWQPDGIEQLVEIVAPKVVEAQLTKDLSQTEAERRFSYLADIADTGGWAVRHAATPTQGSAMISDVFNEAQSTVDVLDTNSGVAQSFDAMISESDARHKQAIRDSLHAPATAPAPMAAPPMPLVTPVFQPVAQQASADDVAALSYNPYPNDIHQFMVQPLAQTPVPGVVTPSVAEPAPQIAQPAPAAAPEVKETPPSTSEKPLSPDIINLANNSDLSIETIQREADRIRKKSEDDGEVFISLR